MKKSYVRFLIAALIGIVVSALIIIFEISSDSIDVFFAKIHDFLFALLLPFIFFIDAIFPTRKKCTNCSAKLHRMTPSRSKLYYEDIIQSENAKALMKAFFICKKCKSGFSYKLKFIGYAKKQ